MTESKNDVPLATNGRPDPESVLDGLKDFQRATVNHVFRRLYEDDDCTRRYLVADEVGLGKTMVARGVIAKTINYLWEHTTRIDIVYVCSNADIARQNITRLKLKGCQSFSLASRITLLPITIEQPKKSGKKGPHGRTETPSRKSSKGG